MKNRNIVLMFIFAVHLFLFGDLLPQEHQKQQAAQVLPSRYFLGAEDNLLLPVNILGLVNKPGQYMVPYRTDLITLIAFAGGFREDAKISKVKIIRNITTNGRYATNGKYATNGRRKKKARIYVVDIKKYFKTGDQRQIPKLKPDDTIIVTGSTTRTINKIFSFVSKGIMLAQIYFLIKVANDR